MLQKQRLQRDGAEHSDAESHDHEGRRGEIAILQQADLRIAFGFRLTLLATNADDAHDRDDGQGDDEIRLQPVFGIAAIEHHLQSADADRQQQRTRSNRRSAGMRGVFFRKAESSARLMMPIGRLM